MPGDKLERSGYVYIMQWRDLYKIGYSSRPRKRWADISRVVGPEVVLLGTVFSSDAKALEGRLHRVYRQYRVRGEWFRLPWALVHKLIPHLPPKGRRYPRYVDSISDPYYEPPKVSPPIPKRALLTCSSGEGHLWETDASLQWVRCSRCGRERRFGQPY